MEGKTDRFRENNCDLQSIQTKITKKYKTKKGTSSATINTLLKCIPNFIGCYAENQVSKIAFKSFPCYLIVNIDSSQLPGSHWLALGVYRNRIEIFDPLGFSFFNWSRIPCDLLKLLHRLSNRRRILISKRIQPDNSILCAFYCIYYCIFRRTVPFSKLCRPFKRLKDNDETLINLFS